MITTFGCSSIKTSLLCKYLEKIINHLTLSLGYEMMWVPNGDGTEWPAPCINISTAFIWI